MAVRVKDAEAQWRPGGQVADALYDTFFPHISLPRRAAPAARGLARHSRSLVDLASQTAFLAPALGSPRCLAQCGDESLPLAVGGAARPTRRQVRRLLTERRRSDATRNSIIRGDNWLCALDCAGRTLPKREWAGCAAGAADRAGRRFDCATGRTGATTTPGRGDMLHMPLGTLSQPAAGGSP